MMSVLRSSGHSTFNLAEQYFGSSSINSESGLASLAIISMILAVALVVLVLIFYCNTSMIGN